MEYKTAEEIIKTRRSKVSGEYVVTEQSVIKSMREYATQEVTKHLKEASDLCKIKSDVVAIWNMEIKLT